jgi:hypothetical protein
MLSMGLPDNSQFVGVWLFLFDIQKGPYPLLPPAPNGSWYLPTNGPASFGLTTDTYSFSFNIMTDPPYTGCLRFGCTALVPFEDTKVFRAINCSGVAFDLYRGENEYTDPNEGYYGGYATVIPVFETDLPEDIATVVAAVGMAGQDRVQAELMGAAENKRAIRLARKADHSCCRFVLAPVTSL